jgi:mRNA-degrading endonuclease RelE of RelBE toxin-antitoxin system
MRIELTAPAQKDLEALEKNMQRRIVEAMRRMQTNPEVADL